MLYTMFGIVNGNGSKQVCTPHSLRSWQLIAGLMQPYTRARQGGQRMQQVGFEACSWQRHGSSKRQQRTLCCGQLACPA
jgi:hypothetical protein